MKQNWNCLSISENNKTLVIFVFFHKILKTNTETVFQKQILKNTDFSWI